MSDDNVFSGLKVVDLSSYIAGPGAAVILADFGADVIKVEPPTGDFWRFGNKLPIEPNSDEAYQWHLTNRNKRSLTLDLKSPASQPVVRGLVEWADVFIVNTPHHARKHLGLEYDDIAALNPRLIYADLTGFGDKGPDAGLPGFDLTAFWARSGLLSMFHDAGSSPTWPVSGSGDNATAVSLYAAIATALYRRERTGKGSYVTTSLLATGVWSAGVMVAGALAGAPMPPLLDRAHPANAGANVYCSSDGVWFVLVAQTAKVADMVKAIGRADLLTDPRFSDPAKLAANRAVLTAIFAEVFAAKPMAYWSDLLGKINITVGVVTEPADVAKDPQLEANDIAVPLEGAGKLTRTISSPFQMVGIDKEPARRGPGLGEHNENVLAELGFDAAGIVALREGGAIPGMEKRAA